MLEQSAEALFYKAVGLAMAGQYRNPSAVPGAAPADAQERGLVLRDAAACKGRRRRRCHRGIASAPLAGDVPS